MKIKNNITILIDAGKDFEKIQYPFVIKKKKKKNSPESGNRGTYLNIINAIYDKPTANIILKWWKIESIPTKIRNKTKISTLAIFIQLVLEVLAMATKKVKEIKGIQIGKK